MADHHHVSDPTYWGNSWTSRGFNKVRINALDFSAAAPQRSFRGRQACRRSAAVAAATRLLATAWSQFFSTPQQKAFATTIACATALPVHAGHLAVGLSELARLNLSMYGAVLAGAQKNRENMLSSRTTDLLAWIPGNMMPSLAAQWAAHISALMEMALQTTGTLNRFAIVGYVETVQHATAIFTAIARRSVLVDDVMDDPRCGVVATLTAARQDPALDNELAR